MTKIIEKEGYKKPIVNCVIMDLDGCIADDRRRTIQWQKDWKNYHADSINDPVHPEQLFLWHRIQREMPIFIFTGRPEYLYKDTVEWLKLHQLEYAKMFMRPDKNHEPSWKLKHEWLQFIISGGANPVLAYDDNDDCVTMYAGNGIPAHHILRSAQ